MQENPYFANIQPFLITAKVTKPTFLIPWKSCDVNLPTNYWCRQSVKMSFYLLESDSFKSFVNELEPHDRLPTRQAMSGELIPAMYNTIKQSVMKTVSKAAAVALTTYTWISLSNEAFVGATAHH